MSKLRVLVADDSKTDRLILQALLKQEGYAVYIARNGQEAIDVYTEYRPDIVIIDAIMPVVDGFEATKVIKQIASDSFVPVIFVTALNDTKSLAHCLDVGGDDFLTKPYNPVILKAKLEAFSRMKKLYEKVNQQKQQIEIFHNGLIAEQHQAKKIFDNIAHSGCLNTSNISYNLNPMSIFNGDILLAAKNPSGNLRIFMGDFTGHSLPAAIGAMPVSEIFYGMTLKGISMEEMLKEINSRLHNILPTGTFCCAICIETVYEEKSARIWNGGLPEAYLLNKGGVVEATFNSNHLALGIISSREFHTDTESFKFKPDQELFFSTDGVIESESAAGEMFGVDRLYKILNTASISDKFKEVKQNLTVFAKDQTDDETFLLLSGKEIIDNSEPVERQYIDKKHLSWEINYSFDEDSLKNLDPVPLMVQPLMEVQQLQKYRSQIFTILNELYKNALNYSVLEIESSRVRRADNLLNFAKHKATKLENLKKAKIDIKINLCSKNGVVLVTIIVVDSGPGFNYQTELENNPDSLISRRLMLLDKLCKTVDYNQKGNQVTITLCWDSTSGR